LLQAEKVFGAILLYKAAFAPTVLLQLLFNHCNGAATQLWNLLQRMDQITIKTPNPKCRLYWCL
jgi:hypothetical protein